MIKASIRENQLNDFRKNGFLTLDNFLNLEYLEKLKKRIELLFEGEFETGIHPDEWNWRSGRDPDDVTRQICNAWKSDSLIKEVVCNPVIGQIISELMGWKGARLIQDNVLWKPPQGKSLSYHQDSAYIDWVVPQSMATCWIPLDNTLKENGTLEFAVKSHLWELCPPSDSFHAPEDYKKELNRYLKNNDKKLQTFAVEVPAGGVSFHHGLTWHGSGLNQTNQDRMVIVAHCVPDDAKFHASNCGGTGKIYRKYKLNNRDNLDDSFFPLLWKNNQ